MDQQNYNGGSSSIDHHDDSQSSPYLQHQPHPHHHAPSHQQLQHQHQQHPHPHDTHPGQMQGDGSGGDGLVVDHSQLPQLPSFEFDLEEATRVLDQTVEDLERLAEQFPPEDGDTSLDHIQPRSKRRKLQLACHFCRRRKLRCDGTQPVCENCSKREEVCTWDDNVRRRGPGKRTKALRDKAAEEAAAAGLTNATGIYGNAKPPFTGLGLHNNANLNNVTGEPSGSVGDDGELVLDTLTTVNRDGLQGHDEGDDDEGVEGEEDGQDTNAALIAAVTAAAAENQGLSTSGQYDDQYNPQHHHTQLQQQQHLSAQTNRSNQSSHSPIAHTLDPNVDPALQEGTTPSTLADMTSNSDKGKKRDPIGVGVGMQNRHLGGSATSLTGSQKLDNQHEDDHGLVDGHDLDPNAFLETQYGLNWPETHGL